jgi:hypothetical protein
MKAVIGISNWNRTRDELRQLAKKIDAGKHNPGIEDYAGGVS